MSFCSDYVKLNGAKLADFTIRATFMVPVDYEKYADINELLDAKEKEFADKHIGDMPARKMVYFGTEDYGRFYIRRVEWHINIHTPSVAV
jgi:hypothetical protein